MPPHLVPPPTSPPGSDELNPVNGAKKPPFHGIIYAHFISVYEYIVKNNKYICFLIVMKDVILETMNNVYHNDVLLSLIIAVSILLIFGLIFCCFMKRLNKNETTKYARVFSASESEVSDSDATESTPFRP